MPNPNCVTVICDLAHVSGQDGQFDGATVAATLSGWDEDALSGEMIAPGQVLATVSEGANVAILELWPNSRGNRNTHYTFSFVDSRNRTIRIQRQLWVPHVDVPVNINELPEAHPQAFAAPAAMPALHLAPSTLALSPEIGIGAIVSEITGGLPGVRYELGGAVSPAFVLDGVSIRLALLPPDGVYPVTVNMLQDGQLLGSADLTLTVTQSAAAPASAPAAFAAGDWALLSNGDGTAELTVLALPGDGGAPISALQISSDGGASFATLPDAAPGSYALDPADGEVTSYILRAMNVAGTGPWSEAKSVDPGAPVPAAFGAADWDLTSNDDGTATLTVLALPDDSGFAISALQVSADGGASFAALSGAGLGGYALDPADDVITAYVLRAVNAAGAGLWSEAKSVNPGAPVPAVFGAGDWALVSNDDGTATLTVLALPDDRGEAITALQISADGGASVTALTSAGLGSHTLDPADNVTTAYVLRAVNAAGAGLWSDAKSVNPGAPDTVPSPFAAGDWVLSDEPSLGGDTLAIDVLALPYDGGTAITGLEYSLDGGASWSALAGTGTGVRSITVLAETQASVVLRALNALGAGAVSDSKAATPTVLPEPGVLAAASVMVAGDGSTANPDDSTGGTFLKLTMVGDWTGADIDPAKISVSATSPGFSAAAPVATARSISCLSRRYWYNSDSTSLFAYHEEDDGTGNTVFHVALDAPIYAGDSNVVLDLADGWVVEGGRNGPVQSLALSETGDTPYPEMQAFWATENHRPLLLRAATFEVCAHAGHAFDQTGKQRPADAVVFEISNGTTTLTRTVTQISNSTYSDETDAYLADVFGANFGTGSDQPLRVTRPSGQMPANPVFACTVDLAAEGFTEGDTITVTATCLPFIGTDAERMISDGVKAPAFAAQTHKILGTGRKYVYVDLSLDPDPSVNPSPQPGVYDNIADALANPNARVGTALTLASRGIDGSGNRNTTGNYDDSLEGAVLLVKPNASNNIMLGTSRSAGAAGSLIAFENDITGVEILPAPGVNGQVAKMTRNFRPSAYQEDGDFPGRLRTYGLAVNPVQSKVIDIDMGSSGQKAYAAFFPSGGPANTPGTAKFCNAEHFIMGGDFQGIPTDMFSPQTVARGLRIAAGANGGNTVNNLSRLSLGCDLGPVRLVNDLTTSGIAASGWLRWGCIVTSEDEPIALEMPNLGGVSILLCACHGRTGALSSWAYKLNADDNHNALRNARIAMTALHGGRLNSTYDHSVTPSGPKWGNEIHGCFLSSENMKRPDFGLVREETPANEPSYYHWGAADSCWYGAGRGWNAVAANYSAPVGPNSYLGPVRRKGYRYGIMYEGNTTAAQMPKPYQDPASGNWSVLDDAAWAGLETTQALVASDPGEFGGKDANDRDDYATNLISAMVPADRVPVPFDIFGTAYPATGMVEAGPVQR